MTSPALKDQNCLPQRHTVQYQCKPVTRDHLSLRCYIFLWKGVLSYQNSFHCSYVVLVSSVLSSRGRSMRPSRPTRSIWRRYDSLRRRFSSSQCARQTTRSWRKGMQGTYTANRLVEKGPGWVGSWITCRICTMGRDFALVEWEKDALKVNSQYFCTPTFDWCCCFTNTPNFCSLFPLIILCLSLCVCCLM